MFDQKQTHYYLIFSLVLFLSLVNSERCRHKGHGISHVQYTGSRTEAEGVAWSFPNKWSSVHMGGNMIRGSCPAAGIPGERAAPKILTKKAAGKDSELVRALSAFFPPALNHHTRSHEI